MRARRPSLASAVTPGPDALDEAFRALTEGRLDQLEAQVEGNTSRIERLFDSSRSESVLRNDPALQGRVADLRRQVEVLRMLYEDGRTRPAGDTGLPPSELPDLVDVPPASPTVYPRAPSVFSREISPEDPAELAAVTPTTPPGEVELEPIRVLDEFPSPDTLSTEEISARFQNLLRSRLRRPRHEAALLRTLGPADTPPMSLDVPRLSASTGSRAAGAVLEVPDGVLVDVVWIDGTRRRVDVLSRGEHQVPEGASVRLPGDGTAILRFPRGGRSFTLRGGAEVVVRATDLLRVAGPVEEGS